MAHDIPLSRCKGFASFTRHRLSLVHRSGVLSGGPPRDGSKVSYDVGQDRGNDRSKAVRSPDLIGRVGARRLSATVSEVQRPQAGFTRKDAIENEPEPFAM